MSKKRMIVYAFDQAVATHHGHGMWRYPGSQDANYKTADYWIELARIAERGRFDAVFIADVLGVQDVYQGSPAPAVKYSGFMPQIDPTQVVVAMAAATEHIGIGVTVAATYEYPYLLARKFSSLDHLTGGRVGWNIVTGYQKSAAVNVGLDDQVPHDTRYEIAEEFLQVVYKLWEGSWEEDAVILDEESGIYTDPTKVHPIEHVGEHFKVPGLHVAEPSPQRTPVLFQAGGSSRGKDFAARHGEVVFTVGTAPELLRPTVDDIRDRAEAQGRPRDSVKVVVHLTVIAAETDEAAQQKHENYRRYSVPEGTLVQLSSVTGVDFSKYDLDEPLEYIKSDALQYALTIFTTADPTRTWTLRDVMEYMEIADWSPVIVGGPETVADELERWMDVADIDGFNLGRVVSHETMRDFVDFVVPELQCRGRMWSEYPTDQTTLRGLTFGSSHVADWHPASQYRGAYVGKRSVADPVES